MNWYQIKKYLYYTHDDFIRDIIALHLKEGTLTDIYNYICKTSLFSIEDRFKRPIIRWYLNSTEQLEMDIDVRFVDSLDIHNKICDFFTGLSCLIDDNIFLLDDIIKEKPLVLMIFKPQTSPQIIENKDVLQI